MISDKAGNTSLATTRVEVPHFKAKSLTVTTKSANRPWNKTLKTITAEVVLPDRVSRSQGCANGSITLITKWGRQDHRRLAARTERPPAR